jgi:hypothetical protein
MTERIEVVGAIVEHSGMVLQGPHHFDGPATGGLHAHLDLTRAVVIFVGLVSAVRNAVAQADFFDALRGVAAASEVDVLMKVIGASEARAKVAWHEKSGTSVTAGVTVGLVGPIRAIVVAIASSCLRNARSVKALESVCAALTWAQVVLLQVASARNFFVSFTRSHGL